MGGALPIERLGPELIRQLRGRRSQRWLSHQLGFESNVLYMWESGRRDPAASELFRLLAKTGRQPTAALRRFPVRLEHDLASAAGIAELLGQLRGSTKITEVATSCGVSRFKASRWLRGQSEPRLSEFLVLFEVLTLRLLDLVAELVDPRQLNDQLAAVGESWEQLERRRQVAFDHPWSQAVLRCLETEAYQATQSHQPGWIAATLNIGTEQEEQALVALQQANLIRHDGVRFRTEPAAVDMSMATTEQRRALKLHWAQVARRAIETDARGRSSWSVFAVSDADFRRLQQLHVDYLNAIRQIVEASEPCEVVGLANVQLLQLNS